MDRETRDSSQIHTLLGTCAVQQEVTRGWKELHYMEFNIICIFRQILLRL
jgi:hypothetical protein